LVNFGHDYSLPSRAPGSLKIANMGSFIILSTHACNGWFGLYGWLATRVCMARFLCTNHPGGHPSEYYKKTLNHDVA